MTYRIIPPTEYVSSLRVGSIDGFFGGEPGGQRAVYEGAGFIHAISRDLWNGHPCCSVTAAESWIKQHPNTFMAFYRAIIAASLHVSDKKNRAGMAKVLAQPQYLNAPEIVVEQVITGRYADGLGNIKNADDRVDYQPFPHYSAAVWLMTQLRRWNMLKEDVDYKKLAAAGHAGHRRREDHARAWARAPPAGGLRQGDHPRQGVRFQQTGRVPQIGSQAGIAIVRQALGRPWLASVALFILFVAVWHCLDRSRPGRHGRGRSGIRQARRPERRRPADRGHSHARRGRAARLGAAAQRLRPLQSQQSRHRLASAAVARARAARLRAGADRRGAARLRARPVSLRLPGAQSVHSGAAADLAARLDAARALHLPRQRHLGDLHHLHLRAVADADQHRGRRRQRAAGMGQRLARIRLAAPSSTSRASCFRRACR